MDLARARRLASAGVDALADAVAVLLPVACAGCGRADRAVCAQCRAGLVPAPRAIAGLGVPAVAAADYGGVLRAVLHSVKERGRTDAAAALAPLLRAAVAAALAQAGATGPGARIELAGIPSSARTEADRGFRHVERMLAAAGLAPSRVLRPVRERDDQSVLDASGRDANLAGALAARGPLVGRRFLVVDDVVTSGASAREAIRALRAAGAEAVGAAFAAETLRRHPAFSANPQQFGANVEPQSRDNTGGPR